MGRFVRLEPRYRHGDGRQHAGANADTDPLRHEYADARADRDPDTSPHGHEDARPAANADTRTHTDPEASPRRLRPGEPPPETGPRG
jgi:hypothetical protein